MHRPSSSAASAGSGLAGYAETTYGSLEAKQSLDLPARLALSLEVSGMSYGSEYGSVLGRLGLKRKWDALSLGVEAALEKQAYGYDLGYEHPLAANGSACRTGKSWHTRGEAAARLGWEGRRNRLRGTFRASQTKADRSREAPERESAFIGYHALSWSPSWRIAETAEAGIRFTGRSREPYSVYRVSLVFQK